MRATNELKKEHQGIELLLRVLQALSVKSSRAEQIQAEHLDGIMEFLSVFVDKCHHGKEEEYLFPALEAVGVQRESGPIGVLLLEHEQGRKLVARFKVAAKEYISGNKTGAAEFQTVINEYVSLMAQHIEKENNVIFPMADARLHSMKDKELFAAFERLEHERIGQGKHEEFHVLLHRLEREYLK